ncbi:MAG: hypothetical protein IPJ88_03765 [Myxococcales bacterium]|nr:MAG: hypothetical protein IPJ88_03765 [Myxococcales bacterium]
MKQNTVTFLLSLFVVHSVMAQDMPAIVDAQLVEVFMSELLSESTPEQTLRKLNESLRVQYSILADTTFDPKSIEDLAVRQKESLESLSFDDQHNQISFVHYRGKSRYLFDQGSLKKIVHEFTVPKKMQVRRVCELSIAQNEMLLELSYDSTRQQVFRIAVSKQATQNVAVQIHGLPRYCKAKDPTWLSSVISKAATNLYQSSEEDPLAAL